MHTGERGGDLLLLPQGRVKGGEVRDILGRGAFLGEGVADTKIDFLHAFADMLACRVIDADAHGVEINVGPVARHFEQRPENRRLVIRHEPDRQTCDVGQGGDLPDEVIIGQRPADQDRIRRRPVPVEQIHDIPRVAVGIEVERELSELVPYGFDHADDIIGGEYGDPVLWHDQRSAILSQGCAASKSAASLSTRSSSRRFPAICNPTGSPSSQTPQGTEITGWPVMFIGYVRNHPISGLTGRPAICDGGPSDWPKAVTQVVGQSRISTFANMSVMICHTRSRVLVAVPKRTMSIPRPSSIRVWTTGSSRSRSPASSAPYSPATLARHRSMNAASVSSGSVRSASIT